MKLTTSAEGKTEVERMILILSVGVSIAIEQGVLSIEDAEKLLYSPYSMEKMKKLGVNNNIVTLINLGCELENVERIIPDKLLASIQEIRQKSLEMLHRMPNPDITAKKWID